MLDDFVTATFLYKINSLVFGKYFQVYALEWLCAFNNLISQNRNVLTNLYGGMLMLH